MALFTPVPWNPKQAQQSAQSGQLRFFKYENDDRVYDRWNNDQHVTGEQFAAAGNPWDKVEIIAATPAPVQQDQTGRFFRYEDKPEVYDRWNNNAHISGEDFAAAGSPWGQVEILPEQKPFEPIREEKPFAPKRELFEEEKEKPSLSFGVGEGLPPEQAQLAEKLAGIKQEIDITEQEQKEIGPMTREQFDQQQAGRFVRQKDRPEVYDTWNNYKPVKDEAELMSLTKTGTAADAFKSVEVVDYLPGEVISKTGSFKLNEDELDTMRKTSPAEISLIKQEAVVPDHIRRQQELEKATRELAENYSEPGQIGQFAESVIESVAQIFSSIGGAVEAAGYKFNNLALQNKGAEIADTWREQLAANPEWAAPEDAGWGDVTTYTRIVGALTPYILASGGMAAGAAAAVAGVGSTAMTILAQGLGGFAFTKSVEGGAAYNEAIALGASRDDALRISQWVGNTNGILEMLPIMNVLNKIPGWKKMRGNVVKRVAKDMAIQGFAEGGTEFWQEVTSNYFMQELDENRGLWDNTLKAFVTGAIGGAGITIGGVAALSPGAREQVIKTPFGLTIEDVSQKAVIDSIKAVTKNKLGMPILEQVMVHDGKMTATDLEIAIIQDTNLPDGMYDIIGNDLVKSTTPINDYPLTPNRGDSVGVALGSDLSTNLKKHLKTIAKDDSMPGIDGVQMEYSPEGLKFVSTDSFALTTTKVPAKVKETGTAIIKNPTKFIKALDKMGKVSIKVSDDAVQFVGDSGRIVVTKINARFPDYKQILPNIKVEHTLDKKEVLSALKVLKPYTEKTGVNVGVAVKKTKDGFSITARNVEGQTKTVNIKASTKTGVRRTGQEVDGVLLMPVKGEAVSKGEQPILFNINFLKNIFDNTKDKSVVMGFTETPDSKPAYFTAETAKPVAKKPVPKAKPKKKAKVYNSPDDYTGTMGEKIKEMEKVSLAYFKANKDTLVKAFLKKHENKINPDDGKEFFRAVGYVPSVTWTAEGVHRAGSNLAKAVTDVAHVKFKGTGNGDQLMLAGAPGVGKTTGIEKLAKTEYDEASIVYDSTLSDFDKAVEKIDKALKAGFRVPIYWTYRNPVDAWLNGVLVRTAAGGRHVPLNVYFPKTEVSAKVILQLVEFYKNEKGAEFRFINNDLGRDNAELVGLDFVKKIEYNRDEVLKQIYDKTDEAVNSKTNPITKAQLPEIYGSDGKSIRERLERGDSGAEERVLRGQKEEVEPAKTDGKLTKPVKAGFLVADKKESVVQATEKLEPLPTEVEENMASEYEALKDTWIGDKDIKNFEAQIEKRALQKDIKEALGVKKFRDEAKGMDRAIQIAIDVKNDPEAITKYYEELTEEQKNIVDLSQNLPKKIQGVVDKISESYREVGLEALEADVIKNVIDNYAARVWETTTDRATGAVGRFGTTTKHAKQRVFTTILEGWAAGKVLKVEGATNNLSILKQEISRTIADKKFVNTLKKAKTIDGDPLLSTVQLEGYNKIDHPNFKVWRVSGLEATDAQVFKSAKNFFITEDGVVMERKELYAPKKIAKNLNNILGQSKLRDIPGVHTITKYNAIIKAWILQSSFFHHMAFLRSYWLGTSHKKWKEMSPRKAYREGLRAMEEEAPLIKLAVRNGLTLGVKQDWSEELLQEKTIIGKMLDKTKASKKVKDEINKLRQRQADFLFGELGSGLKAKSFLIEYRNQIKKHPNEDVNVLAKRVAELINDDFGGLHLQRMGRNPTGQHIFRLAALAPDWTESNVNTMVKMFGKGGKDKRRFYRKFWAGVLAKGAMMTVMANFILAGGDPEEFWENYKIAWKQGNLKWMAADITPIYKAFGGKSDEHKYFWPIGHFKDVFKFIAHPIRSAKQKGSVVFNFFLEAVTGTDWAGKRYTELDELIGTDDKGLYQTTRKGFYKEGDPKGGKLAGQTVTWDFIGGNPITYKQLPSFIISQIKGSQPVQLQNLMAWTAGEMSGFDAVANSMGLGVSSSYNLTKEAEDKEKTKGKGKNIFEVEDIDWGTDDSLFGEPKDIIWE